MGSLLKDLNTFMKTTEACSDCLVIYFNCKDQDYTRTRLMLLCEVHAYIYIYILHKIGLVKYIYEYFMSVTIYISIDVKKFQQCWCCEEFNKCFSLFLY